MFDLAPDTDQSLLQSPGFAAALRLCGQDPIILPSGLLLLYRQFLGMPLAMLPRADPPHDLARQLSAAGLARVPLVLSPERSQPVKGLRLRKPASTAEIDLRPPFPHRRRMLHQKWRNQLRRAETANLRIRQGCLRPDDPLPELDAAQAKANGYRTWPVPLTRAFANVNPAQTQVFTATQKGHVVAQMLFLLHGSTRASYHMGHTTPLGRRCHAHNLILWTAQNWLAEQGIRRLDLGLLHPQTPNLNRFKLRAGATACQMGGTWIRWSPLARNGQP